VATGFLSHELYHWHNTGNGPLGFRPNLYVQPGVPAENPETKRRFRNLMEVSGLLDQMVTIKPRAATDDEIARFHGREYMASVKAMSAADGGNAGEETLFGTGSYEIAQLSTGGTIAMIDAVLSGAVRNGYALVRPPGHHAEANFGRGFCIFGNVVVGIMHARAQHKVGRVATVDWDVHHGNGTEDGFYADPDTLTISLHQQGLYPVDRGGMEARGRDAGVGSNINIPLPAGSGDGAYLHAFEQVVLPALRRFKPELIVVPSGFDASGVDPLGRMMVASDGFRRMTKAIMAAADELCGGRLVLSHEGGYSEFHVPYCGLAVMEELSGIKTKFRDPYVGEMLAWGGQALQPHQAALIAQVAELVAGVPS
jgi:acetoin utilization deacetylase AcuC-like enzyme